MKKRILLGTIFSAALLGSCSDDQTVATMSEEKTLKKEIKMTSTDFVNGSASRTTIDDSGAFLWAANDTVGIFPDKGHQVDFPMVNGDQAKTATFSGGGWALKASSHYIAYYPFVGDTYLDRTAIPVSFEGQNQDGNSNAHLGKYDFMVAHAQTPTDGTVNFNFKHLVSLVYIDITVPQAGPVSHVALSAKKAEEPIFVTKGTVDITQATPTIAKTAATKYYKIPLSNVTATAANEVIRVRFMMAPIDLTNQDINVDFLNNGTLYTATIDKAFTNKKLEAGKYYKMQVKNAAIIQGPSSVDWIDFNLPSGNLWASHNLGATVPEEGGDCYAWGEISTKQTYTRDNCISYNEDIKIQNNPQYDAARAYWGSEVQIPSKEDFEELFKNLNSATLFYKINLKH